MKSLLAAALLTLTLGTSAFGFDAATQDIVGRYKANKLVAVADVAQLMRSSERWCYAEADGGCAWSDIYLEVTDSGAEFEIGNAWSDSVDIAFTDRGEFRDDRYICETGYDWVPNMRAFGRADDVILLGRDLQAIKTEVAAGQTSDVIDCFDYLYLSADAEAQTILLRQRQYTEGEHNAANDVEVTLHFDPKNAAALTWY